MSQPRPTNRSTVRWPPVRAESRDSQVSIGPSSPTAALRGGCCAKGPVCAGPLRGGRYGAESGSQRPSPPTNSAFWMIPYTGSAHHRSMHRTDGWFVQQPRRRAEVVPVRASRGRWKGTRFCASAWVKRSADACLILCVRLGRASAASAEARNSRASRGHASQSSACSHRDSVRAHSGEQEAT
jgi:hypothetical protein